jgi:cyclic beta-1,2-glucan synthetase
VERQVSFGIGYARFACSRAGLQLEETLAIAPDAPVLVRVLRIRNKGASARRFRVVQYAGIALAETIVDSRGGIDTDYDEGSGSLLFSRPQNDFRKGWAFVASNVEGGVREVSRSRFLGHARLLGDAHFIKHGQALAEAGDDGLRCAAFAGEIEVGPGGERIVVTVIGQAQDKAAACALAARYRKEGGALAAVEAARAWWQQELSVLRIETDRPDFDRLVNDWLPYQIRTSRLWGRTGPQQRSGAFGYRDQLQDVLPLCGTHPQRARAQILLHAARQFREGDAVKWWHTAWDGGCSIAVRTAASDPQLWLPYVVIRYLQATGDEALLQEMVPFLEGRELPPGQEGIMFVPRPATDKASVYEHCRRAIDWTLTRIGPHGVPLMGSGDWNDGIDGVGLGLKGESAWMGFFLHQILQDFALIAARFEGVELQRRYDNAAAGLRKALEPWWRNDEKLVGYLRGTTDNGADMIYADALMTAWPALSGAVDLQRSLAALEGGLRVLEKDNRVLLLSPAFDDDSHPYPGRIAEYPPGVRENGGQYSHGDSWIVDAYMHCAAEAAAAGDPATAAVCRARAWEIWWKISPLTKTDPNYGLPPHQQPADVYDGAGHGGRGGWAWYTGAAARMLSAAYTLMGIRFSKGEASCELPSAESPAPRLRQVRWRGRVISPPASEKK